MRTVRVFLKMLCYWSIPIPPNLHHIGTVVKRNGILNFGTYFRNDLKINVRKTVTNSGHWFDSQGSIPTHHEIPGLVPMNFWRVVDFVEKNTSSRY